MHRLAPNGGTKPNSGHRQSAPRNNLGIQCRMQMYPHHELAEKNHREKTKEKGSIDPFLDTIALGQQAFGSERDKMRLESLYLLRTSSVRSVRTVLRKDKKVDIVLLTFLRRWLGALVVTRTVI